MKQYFVYRNLHTGTFSLKFNQKVIDHPSSILIKDAKFNVSENGRQKVLETKRKNVHATVSGFSIIINPNMENYQIIEEVKYNPYKHCQFMLNDQKIYEFPLVLLLNNKIYLVKLK